MLLMMMIAYNFTLHECNNTGIIALTTYQDRVVTIQVTPRSSSLISYMYFFFPCTVRAAVCLVSGKQTYNLITTFEVTNNFQSLRRLLQYMTRILTVHD